MRPAVSFYQTNEMRTKLILFSLCVFSEDRVVQIDRKSVINHLRCFIKAQTESILIKNMSRYENFLAKNKEV